MKDDISDGDDNDDTGSGESVGEVSVMMMEMALVKMVVM